jgi:uncharacterized protein (TIGR02757 family)
MLSHRAELGPYLDRLAGIYGPGHLESDPIAEVRRFERPEDRELAAFLAAGLAFGRVDLILAHLRDLWDRLDHAPAAVADAWRPSDVGRLDGFVHRWVDGAHLAEIIAALGRTRRRHGSLRAAFLAGYEPEADDLAESLSRFVRVLLNGLRWPGATRAPEVRELPQGVRTFFADPAAGGACKRLNLFLRWMVRPDDGIDLGLWAPVRPAQLVMPLDTHVARLSAYLGLTTRRTVDWKMAREVRDRLREWDPTDPVRYDFALSRLGILDACPRRVDPAKCTACSLVPVCVLGRDRAPLAASIAA